MNLLKYQVQEVRHFQTKQHAVQQLAGQYRPAAAANMVQSFLAAAVRPC